MNHTLRRLYAALADASNAMSDYRGEAEPRDRRDVEASALEQSIDFALRVVLQWEEEDRHAFEERT